MHAHIPFKLIAIAVILLPCSASLAQEKFLGPPISQDQPKAAAQASETAAAQNAPEAPASPFAGTIWTRPKLTGDWFGHRDTLAAHGITLDASLTQFSQGVTSGGRQQDWIYGGHGDYFFNMDGEKAGLWKGFFVTMHAETRYGRDVNGLSGALVPPNLTMLFPQANTDITAVTSLKFTQTLSERLIVFGGKLNMIDEFQFNFVGKRNEGFMSTLVFPVVFLRTVPYSTYGAGAVVMKGKEPIASVMVIDPTDYSTRGPTDLFGRGAVLIGTVIVPTNFFDKPGHHFFGGSWSSASYKAVDRSSFAIVPGEGVVAGTESTSWCLYYAFDQAIWIDPCNPKRSWGLFGNAGIADGNPNPIRWSFAVGAGGSSMLPRRPLDTFGAAFYYVNLGSDFKDLLGGPVLGSTLAQRDEHGVELFYNVAFTPWCKLTADLQIVRPSTQRFDTAIIPGVRLKIDF